MDYSLLGLLALIAMASMQAQLLGRLRADVRRVERKVDRLLAHADIAWDDAALPTAARDALEKGDRMRAIKELRADWGLDLASAVEIIDKQSKPKDG